MNVFSTLEYEVLKFIADAHPEGALIKTQLLTAQIIARRSGGQDFLTSFSVDPDAEIRLSRGPLVGDAWAHVRGLRRGMTFLLWADEDGYLTGLEGASLGEDLSGLDFNGAEIEFFPTPEGDFDSFEPPPPSWTKN